MTDRYIFLFINYMNLELISYEYNIVFALNTKYNADIKNELLKVVLLIINMIEITITNKSLEFLCSLFFSEIVTNYGNIGNQTITTKQELTDLINVMNIRELFTIINNFRQKIDCFMFELLLNYEKSPETFMQQYPFLDEMYIKYIINFIENMLDVDILDLTLCYNEHLIVPCEPDKLPFYRSVHNDVLTYPTWNYSNICSLWLPSTYGNTNQLLTKESKANKLYDIVAKSIKKNTNNHADCTKHMNENFPFVEPLSDKENEFLKSKSSDNNKFLYAICNSEPNNANFSTQLRKKYNKLQVSYTSGHTVIMLMICKYFKNINLGLITLGCIIWLVPNNHSITEIFLAAKKLNVFNDYKLKQDTYESVNEMLALCGLSKLNQGGIGRRRKTRRFKKLLKRRQTYKKITILESQIN